MAAQLMPNNTDETARALCTAGTWLKDRDPEGADQFYKALVRRCRKTAMGQQADVLRWFPAQSIDGDLPRLETMDITAEVTNAVTTDNENTYSTEFPVPGRKYAVQEDEDVYIIARAVQRSVRDERAGYFTGQSRTQARAVASRNADNHSRRGQQKIQRDNHCPYLFAGIFASSG